MQREAWYGCYREQWTVLLTDDAFGHPAKMARGLVYRLVRTGLERGWWRRDTLMVDPFGGVGTTGLACSAHGLESLLVELEPRFVRIADGYDCPGVRSGAAPEDLCPECLDPERADKRDPDALAPHHHYTGNFDLHAATWAQSGLPRPRIVQGDSRRLVEIVWEKVGACVASPPYADGGVQQGTDRHPERMQGTRSGQGSYGVLTSPMFTPAQSGGGIAVNGYQGAHGDGMGLHYTADSAPQSPGNLAALPIGDVAAVGSPPYADERLTGQRQFRSRFHPQRPLAAEADADRYGDHVGDLAKLPIGDVAAVCSPPYEASISASKGKGGIEWQPEWGPRRDNSQITTGMRYSESPDNLGNREGETYWSAIACILEQLWELLPPGGHVAWVVKAFVRNRQLVDLPAMSLRLMESLGWEPVCWIDAMQVAEAKQFSLMPEIVPHYRKSRKSFFRRNAEAKGSPAIDAEVVLVVRKPAA